jgi:ethanolamine utilization protein EutA (predicted chaperonin)
MKIRQYIYLFLAFQITSCTAQNTKEDYLLSQTLLKVDLMNKKLDWSTELMQQQNEFLLKQIEATVIEKGNHSFDLKELKIATEIVELANKNLHQIDSLIASLENSLTNNLDEEYIIQNKLMLDEQRADLIKEHLDSFVNELNSKIKNITNKKFDPIIREISNQNVLQIYFKDNYISTTISTLNVFKLEIIEYEYLILTTVANHMGLAYFRRD